MINEQLNRSILKKLGRYRCSGPEKKNFNYVRIKKNGGSYNIPSQSENEFLDLYADVAVNKINLNLAQKPTEIKSMFVDIDLRKGMHDLRIMDDKVPRLITDEMVDSLAKIYCDVITRVLTDEAIQNMTNKKIYILKRPYSELIEGNSNATNPSSRYSKIKDGFHYFIPGLIVDRPTASYISDLVRTIAEYSTGPMTQYNGQKWLDDVMKKTCWCLYGSSKDGGPIYYVNRIMDIVTREISFKHNKTFKELVKLFSIHGHIIRSPLSIEADRIISTKYIKPELTFIAPVSIDQNPDITDEFVEQLALAFQSLNQERADVYSQWYELLMMTKSASRGDSRVYKVFEDFSKRSHKYNENDLNRRWHAVKIIPGWSWGKLYTYLKLDNPDMFKKLLKENAISRILSTKTWSDFNVGKLLELLLNGRYRTDLIGNKHTFYKFHHEIWKSLEEPVCLRIFMSTEVPVLIEKAIGIKTNYMIRCHQSGGTVNGKFAKSSIDKLCKLLMNVTTRNKKITYQHALGDIIYKENFVKSLDKNDTLFAFSNGVFDFEKNQFRPGRQDDLISKQANCKFVENLDFKNDPDILAIKKFFTEIFPRKEIKKYATGVLSHCFIGNRIDAKCWLCHGHGANGKSVLFDLINRAFGTYCAEMPFEYFTNMKNIASNAARPDTLRLIGRRIVFSSECNKTDQWNLAAVKTITGGNKLMARELYGKKVREVESRFRLFFQVNTLPKLDDVGYAVVRRFIVVPFERCFVSRYETVPDGEFPHILIDDELPSKIAHWSQSGKFLTYLLHILLKYRSGEKTLIIPDSIAERTEDYFNQNNYFKRYCSDNIEPALSENILINILFMRYKEWVQNNHFSKRASEDRIEFENFLETFYGKIHLSRGKLLNVKFKTN